MTTTTISGYKAYAGVVYVASAFSVATLANSAAGKAEILAVAALLGVLALAAPRYLRAPSPEAIERVLHGWVVPAGILLALALFVLAVWCA